MRRAAAVIGFADGRSAGVGESYSRVLLHGAGLPRPELLLPVCDPAGHSLGTAAFGYRDQQVLGEFDGPGPLPTELLGRDERRTDAGWRVLRWTWTDLYSPGALAVRVADALGVPVPRPPASLLGDGELDLGGG